MAIDQTNNQTSLNNNTNSELLENSTLNSPYSKNENSVATSFQSFAEGYNTVASGIASHSEGAGTLATGEWSHAEGSYTKAVGASSHTEGILTKAMGTGAHTEGYETTAIGTASHSEGIKTTAKGYSAHVEGVDNTANGDFSHVEGKGNSSNLKSGAHIIGSYGDATMEYSWHLANGISPAERGLAARIGRDGIGAADFGWIAGSGGYSELFETLDGNTIEPGYFVSLRGRKIQIANTQDRFILGVTTATSAFLGNGGELRWKDKYLTDEWGRIRYQEVTVPALIDEQGNVIIPEHKERKPIINQEWKKDQEYIPRSMRPEWVAVCLVGQVLVRDNGACRINSYCMVSDSGIAIPSARGYRVLERRRTNQISILLRSASFSMKNPQDNK